MSSGLSSSPQGGIAPLPFVTDATKRPCCPSVPKGGEARVEGERRPQRKEVTEGNHGVPLFRRAARPESKASAAPYCMSANVHTEPPG